MIPSKSVSLLYLSAILILCVYPSSRSTEAKAELKDISVNGGLTDGKAHLTIEAVLNHPPGETGPLVYSTSIQHSINATHEKLEHTFAVTVTILQGDPKEVPLTIVGDGQIRHVSGSDLRDWSIRQETNSVRTLILRPKNKEISTTKFVFNITGEQSLDSIDKSVLPMTLIPAQLDLFNGYVQVSATRDLEVEVLKSTGLVPVDKRFLPEELQGNIQPDEPERLVFRFLGSSYQLPLKIVSADPETRRVVLHDFKLTGQISQQSGLFTLTGIASVKNPKGGRLDVLSGAVAMTSWQSDPESAIQLDHGRYLLVFDRAGNFPIELKFTAAVRQSNGWDQLDFRIAPSAPQPLVLHGLAANTQFQFPGASKPERKDSDFLSYLPPNGVVRLSWKEAHAETQGKLFFAAEMLSQIGVSSGLMRQTALLDLKVMQGEVSQVLLRLHGVGEVTRVQGDQVLAWNLEAITDSQDRRLVIKLNQVQKDRFSLQLQIQTAIQTLPQTLESMQIRPENATRFAGYFRIVNEGAVRLDAVQSSGLSQISPEQFPESDATKAAFSPAGKQQFAYRFSGGDYVLRLQADQVLPEVGISQVLAYHLGETEQTIDAEIEMEIRESSLRELLLRVPQNYSIARITASGLSDYFLHDAPGTPSTELRLVYAQPIAGRQLVQLRLERNQSVGTTNWVLPRIEVSNAKWVRGHVGVSCEPGLRLAPERVQGLAEIPTAFFPRKLAGIQSAFRISDAAWEGTLRIERLPQAVQADVLHLFSVGEGVAYGSSVINYAISGAPVGVFQVELSAEYSNIEFTGKDIRNWQKTTNGYVIQLHTPVSENYTLLASYERPFHAQGDTLAFLGARPTDVQSEQGYTLVISDFQFQVQPIDVSAGLVSLEVGEVPAEYRLLFDAPVLAAYRYLSRPFNLRLALRPLAQGDSLSQVVERASLTTHISKAGQVVTNVRYFLKNRGHPNLRVELPPKTELWSATVNDLPVVPVTDSNQNLIPLPQRADPNAILTIDLKLASKSADSQRLQVGAPAVNAPIMLAEWKLEPDTGQRLIYRGGSLTPVGGVPDRSGFAGLIRTFQVRAADSWSSTVGAFLLMGLTILVWRWTTRDGVYRFSFRYWIGLLLGLMAFTLSVASFARLESLTIQSAVPETRDLTFMAPVQQAGSSLFINLNNFESSTSVYRILQFAWPALLALAVWFVGAMRGYGPIVRLAGWALAAWAALRSPNGASVFLIVVAVCLLFYGVLPAFRRLASLPRRSQAGSPTSPPGSFSPALPLVLIGSILFFFMGGPIPNCRADEKELKTLSALHGEKGDAENALPGDFKPTPLADTVKHQIRVEENYVNDQVQVRWRAGKGQRLPLLFDPAILIHATYPTNALRWVKVPIGNRSVQQLIALESGVFNVEMQYQVQIVANEKESGFGLPTQFGIANEADLTIAGEKVDVVSDQAVSIEQEISGTNTVAHMTLLPVNEAWIAWKPRSRDVRQEKPVFYAELNQLYVPSAGVIEAACFIAIRPAQGEVKELSFELPGNATVTDVSTIANPTESKDMARAAAASPLVSLWRFDPDTRKLRVSLASPQSRPFGLLLRLQNATGPLPYEQTIGLVSIEGAADQIGLLGLATGSEVQLDTLSAEGLAPINLEDFPRQTLQNLQPQIAGLALRNAYRYADAKSKIALRASAVEPDVRVETKNTLSLSEDRVVWAANATVAISRAGVFRLSFELPPNLEVESITGEALSHWIQSRNGDVRLVTLNLRAKTEGQQQFAITLSGPGVKASTNWAVPKLNIREATKQQGTLLVVPEQGMRLQIAARTGITQLDPQKSGIRQQGVLAFRILPGSWDLALAIEQVDAWIQTTSLQHATVTEAAVKVVANLQYQIENTGLKAFRLLVPTNIENVRFQGDQIADFRVLPGTVTNGMQVWEVKLHRRVMGQYLLQSTYQTRLPNQATEAVLRGLTALDANLQRGYVTIQAGGRLQLRVDALPPALQASEWQGIPRNLQQDLQTSGANFTYRLVDPNYQLNLKIDRHQAAKLLAGRVDDLTLTSAISDDGVMLTHVRLSMIPGDKRLLYLTLPPGARFWFAFVNQNGVWPWREQDRILIPLEAQVRDSQIVPVEIFYSSEVGASDAKKIDFELVAPKFDLPLENITWRVFLNEKWQLQHWAGSLQLEDQRWDGGNVPVDLQTYLQSQTSAQKEKTKEAEQWLALGNSALEKGDPQRARHAFQAAYGLSQGDDAFNEDARVQLNNLKLQQALVGLNLRQASGSDAKESASAKLRELRVTRDAKYTQQDAKAIIDRNTTDDNAAFLRVAQRLIQQQDAAVSSPGAIRTSIPEQGRILVFRRAVVVDPWADLHVHLRGTAAQMVSWRVKVMVLAATIGILAICLRSASDLKRSRPTNC